MQRYRSVFPQFGELDITLPEGFIDESSLDRAMPTFIKHLPNGNVLRLWIDFADKAKSKFPNDHRFCLSVYNANFVRLHDDIKVNRWSEAQLYILGLQEHNTVHSANR